MPNDLDPRYAPPSADASPPVDEKDTLGWLLLATPAVGGVLEAVLPAAKASTVVGAGVILMTVALINIDAQKRRQHPTPWLFGAFCMFAITYPVYMHYRTKWGAPRRLGLALVSLALLLGGMVVHAVLFDG